MAGKKTFSAEEVQKFMKDMFPSDGDLCTALCENLSEAELNLGYGDVPGRAALIAFHAALLACKQQGCLPC